MLTRVDKCRERGGRSRERLLLLEMLKPNVCVFFFPEDICFFFSFYSDTSRDFFFPFLFPLLVFNYFFFLLSELVLLFITFLISVSARVMLSFYAPQ